MIALLLPGANGQQQMRAAAKDECEWLSPTPSTMANGVLRSQKGESVRLSTVFQQTLQILFKFSSLKIL